VGAGYWFGFYTNILHGGLAALNNFDFIKAKHVCNYKNNIPVFHNYTVDIKLQYITDFLVKELRTSTYICVRTSLPRISNSVYSQEYNT